jgi:hypothetical protein
MSNRDGGRRLAPRRRRSSGADRADARVLRGRPGAAVVFTHASRVPDDTIGLIRTL